MADDDNKRGATPEFYTNSVRLAVNPFDVTLEFGVQDVSKLDPTKIGQQNVTLPSNPVAIIRFSPQLALILTRILARAIEQYEQQNGKIPVQSEMLKQLGILQQ